MTAERMTDREGVCEECGCTWERACLIMTRAGRMGCSWDEGFKAAGRWVCSMCAFFVRTREAGKLVKR